VGIDKIRRRAAVRGYDGRRMEVNFFLREFAEEHSGRELILDILNSHTSFISIEDFENQGIVFVNKGRIMCVELPERDLLEQSMRSPQSHVSVELINGELLSGSFFIEMPPERSRMSDYLNFTPMFLYLCREQGDIILNKDYIAYMRD
jgi:hypothetical protein